MNKLKENLTTNETTPFDDLMRDVNFFDKVEKILSQE